MREEEGVEGKDRLLRIGALAEEADTSTGMRQALLSRKDEQEEEQYREDTHQVPTQQ